MRWRDFFQGIIGAAAAWPLTGRAQQREQLRRIGILASFEIDDPQGQALIESFRIGLGEHGLIEGPSRGDMWRRAAEYVDKIFKGTKAGDIAVEQPTRFELLVNVKTAKALGLNISPILLARADEVIE